MTIPQNVVWAIFAAIAIVVVGGLLFLFLRGERVGTMRVVGRIFLNVASLNLAGSVAHVRLTVAREGGPATRVQMRVTMAMSMSMERLEPRAAIQLAELLESASGRLRAP